MARILVTGGCYHCNMEYNRARHGVHLLNYHLVWCPKYRSKVLVGRVKQRLEELITETGLTGLFDLIAFEVMHEHLHMFVSTAPTVPASRTVKAVKGRSYRKLRDEFPHLRRLPSLWTSSYSASWAGNVSSETIQGYIEA